MSHEPVEAYPLHWPSRFPRTPAAERRRANFGAVRENSRGWKERGHLTVAEARTHLLDELDRLGAEDPILSTNVKVRLDGLPYSGTREPDDTGVAVYFVWDGQQRVLACDRWNRVADNMRALAKSVEAMRGLDRWGASDILRGVFTGFQALPERTGEGHIAAWWDILGVHPRATREQCEHAYRRLAHEAHPDRGSGDRRRWDVLQEAIAQARAATAGQA